MKEVTLKYYRSLASVCSILVGSFLLMEHAYRYGGLDLDDVIGHETYGILLVFLGIIFVSRWKGRYIIWDNLLKKK